MSEISLRPWKIDYDNIFDVNGEKILGLREWIAQDVCHMVNCVNEHDSLIARAEKAEAEVERLKFELNQIKTNYALIKLTEPRKERMKKCANGEDEDCLGCICNICIMTPDIQR